ncbi:MAG: hypothetical protein JKZ03_06880 [Flavobacteriaceae bacterium]|nr:hypothetical protein [Flavobacteriaceae bacterium]
MKKLYLILFTVFLNLALFSCTPESINGETEEQQACCEKEETPPPPPSG